ncbi:response regulator [Clostridium sp. Marseille-P299]|uniref:response regulator n=1 Tax=Clostridium sp. Marseille-P299 TaxID=1805477 RepID=UPI000832802F|nr:response regulator [Clostridium sp. Marseille-P299]
MGLYRIMLVDDEEEVRRSMIKTMKWEEAGFIVVGDAENGKDALEKIEIYEPDVILTDIKMPYMDGLELARQVKENYPSTRIVVFSGFDDFEYAKQAIQCNVTEYILKPLNGEELTTILMRIRDILNKEMEEKRSIETLRESYKKNLPLLKEHFFLDLVHGKLDADTIVLKLQEYKLQNLIGNSLVVACTEISLGQEKINISNQYKKEVYHTLSVERCFEEKLSGIYEYALFHSGSRIHMILALKESQSLSHLIVLLNHVCKECKRIHDLDVTIGLGEAYPHLEQVKKSYKEAKAALGYQKIMGKGITIYIKDMEPLNHRKPMEFLEGNELIAAIKFGSKENILGCIQQTFDKMQELKLHTIEYQLYILSFVHMIVKLLNDTGIDTLTIFDNTVDLNELIASLQDSNDLKNWLLQTCNKISDHIGTDRENATQNVINSAKLLIEKLYSDPLLSVEVLCQHLHITPTYFSTIFKKETGQSYVSYLTRLRMEKAKEFIELSDDKTYVIARKVGYEDPNYFSYVFKKQFGVSPSRYRGKRENA